MCRRRSSSDRSPGRRPRDIVDLVFGQHVEGLVGDDGERQADIGRNGRGVDPVVHQHESAIDAPFVGDLAVGAEVDALDVIGRAGLDGAGVGKAGRDQFARIADVGVEQRGRRQQMAVEQFPFGADFRRLASTGPKIWLIGDVGLQAAVIGRCAVEFGADRIGRRAVGRIDAGDRQRLDDERRDCSSTCRTTPTRSDSRSCWR